MKFALLALLLASALTACLYKMPDRNVIATAPHTNNPIVTREKAAHPLPGMK